MILKEIAAKAGAIVLDEPKKGKAHAVEKLFRCVSADYYILSDGDLTYDPKISKSAIEKCKDLNADMLVGVRKSASGQKTYRLWASFWKLGIYKDSATYFFWKFQ